MPKITITEPQVDIQRQPTPQVNSENFTGGWKNATEALKTLDDTVQQFKKVRDYNEVSSAELGLRQELGQIEAAAAAEQDPTKIEDYQKKIDEAIGRHSSGISDKLVQDEARNKFNLAGYSAYSGIASDFRKKSINIGQGNFLTATDQYERDYTNASDPVNRERIKAEWMDSLTKAQQAGLFAADDVAKMKLVQTKKFDERDLMYDVQNLPDQVDNRRRAGAYASLTDKEVAEGVAAAGRMRERLEKQQKDASKKAQIANEIEVISGAANGMVYGLDEVNAMVGTGEIRPEIGKAYVKYVTSPESIDPTVDESGYSKMVEGIFKAGNQESMVTAIKDTLEGGADGKAKQEDIQNLIALANMRAKELYSIDKLGLKTGSKQVEVDALYRSVIDWTNSVELTDKQRASVTADWIDSVLKNMKESGADIRQATKDVITRAQTAINPNRVKYSVDDVIKAPNGKSYKVVGWDTDGEPLVEMVK